MARKYQEAEKMQTCAVRMGATMLARIDAYGARLKAAHPGLRVERADAVRDLMLKALALVEDHADQQADLEDHADRKAANPQDHERTTGRTGRKRVKAAQEG